jgi:hypothetical protein
MNLVCAILERKGPVLNYTKDNPSVIDEAVNEIIELLSVEGVEVTVRADDNFNIYDILLNGESRGYYFLRTISRQLDIDYPCLLYQGEYNEEGLRKFDEDSVVIIPLFGEDL